MNKYIIWNFKGEPEKTESEYSIGEIILTKNNIPFKCMGKQKINNEIIYHFKQGKIRYEF